MAMIGRFSAFGLSRSSSIASRIRVAKAYASSRPTCPSRTQGNRLSGFGTTQRNIAVSRHTCASTVSTEPESPVRGWSFLVSAWNQVLPRNPTYSLIVRLLESRLGSTALAGSLDQSVSRYQGLRYVHGIVGPVRFCAAQVYRRARTCEPLMRSRQHCP